MAQVKECIIYVLQQSTPNIISDGNYGQNESSDLFVILIIFST